MGTYVEANSLSDISEIAANPPKYPRNPTENKRHPLTLYIARVPGSRDIILTTLKPQLKNVTAEDVASSFYYLHLNTDDDSRFLADNQADTCEETEADTSAIAQKPVPRKPLPETTVSSLKLNPQGQLNQSRLGPGVVPISGLTPKPNRGDLRSQGSYTRSPDHAKGSVQRKPLGPRPLQSDPSNERKLPSGDENQLSNSRPQLESGAAARVSSDSSRSDQPKYDGVTDHEGSKNSFSITIIRRDPSSGAQWNIGTIARDCRNRGAKATSHPKNPYFDIYIHLTTPGYMHFLNSQAIYPDETLSPLENQQLAPDYFGRTTADRTFDRQVRMEGSSFWDRTSKQHKRSQSDVSDKLGTMHGSNEGSISASGLSKTLPDSHDIVDPHGSRSKGYVFFSPWGGRCKFSTGGGGRSLRCKHTMPGPISANSAAFESSSQISVAVSELRFNLPSSALFNALVSPKIAKGPGNDSGHFSVPKFGHLRNKLSARKVPPPLPPRPHPTSFTAMYPSDEEKPPPIPPRSYQESHSAESSDAEEPQSITHGSHPFRYTPKAMSEEEVEERLDLSIGQEKAGGGNRGKRAKLGKLIIEDEGFKMLDLVVAANMGVWWSVWEPNHR